MTNNSSSKFVADAASVRQQFPAMGYADAGSVGHEVMNLELLSLVTLHSVAVSPHYIFPELTHLPGGEILAWTTGLPRCGGGIRNILHDHSISNRNNPMGVGRHVGFMSN